MSVGGMRLGLA